MPPMVFSRSELLLHHTLLRAVRALDVFGLIFEPSETVVFWRPFDVALSSVIAVEGTGADGEAVDAPAVVVAM